MNHHPGQVKIKRKIKNLLLDTRFQIKFIARVWLFSLLALAAIGASVYFLNKLNVADSPELVETVMDINRRAEQEGLRTLISVIVISALFLIITFVLFSIYTHRVAGPILRFTRCLEAVGRKDLTQRAFLRKEDEFKELAETYNHSLDDMAANLEEILAELNALELLSRDIGQKKIQKGMTEKIGRIRAILGAYKTH